MSRVATISNMVFSQGHYVGSVKTRFSVKVR